MPWFSREADSISRPEVEQMCQRLLDEARRRLNIRDFRRVLLLPPDLTRAHSGAGWITETLYKLLPKSCDIHVIPTLGQHEPHTREQNAQMFGSIPHERIHPHDWRAGCLPPGRRRLRGCAPQARIARCPRSHEPDTTAASNPAKSRSCVR